MTHNVFHGFVSALGSSPPKVFVLDVVVGLVLSNNPEFVVAVALLLAGPPMMDRSKVMTQTKRDILVLQVGGWSLRLTTPPP